MRNSCKNNDIYLCTRIWHLMNMFIQSKFSKFCVESLTFTVFSSLGYFKIPLASFPGALLF